MIPLALELLARDARGLAGAIIRGRAGPAREAVLQAFLESLAPAGPVRRIPLSVTPDRLLGGLDLTATIAAGRPVMQPGLLEGAQHGVLILPSAERAPASVIAALAALLDGPDAPVVLALDESEDDEPGVAAALAERLAFRIELDAAPHEPIAPTASACAVSDRDAATALAAAGLALGTISARADLFATAAAWAHAARHGRTHLTEADVEVAAALVLAPRATRLPASAEPPPPPPSEQPNEPPRETTSLNELDDRVLEAVRAQLPRHLLEHASPPPRRGTAGRSRGEGGSDRHGRRIGTRRGDPRTGARLDLVETLRAAAPWQRIRDRVRPGRVAVRKDDFRVQRLRRRIGTTVLFAVDASGSQALHRLAETKGAIELLLAESYVRRDRVALIAFRGTGAEEILPPTRSLARARRVLTGLPGGGGTPLATALVESHRLADRLRRERDAGSILLVLLTDARANVALDGTGGRPRAEADALEAASALRSAGVPSVLIDTAPRPSPLAARLATALGAHYVPLPVADATAVSGVVRMAMSA